MHKKVYLDLRQCFPFANRKSCSLSLPHMGVVGWCDGAGQTSRPILIIVGQGPTSLTVGAGWGCLDIFTLVYHLSFLSPSLSETAR